LLRLLHPFPVLVAPVMSSVMPSSEVTRPPPICSAKTGGRQQLVRVPKREGGLGRREYSPPSLSGLTGSWRYGRPIPVVAHAGGSLRYGLSIVRSGLVISGWNWEPTISSKDGPARVVEPIPWAIGNAFLVESWWALAPTTITAIRVMLQAALEDRTVRSEPTTHQERAGHVRYGSRYSNA